MLRTSTRTNVLLALALLLSASRIAEAQTTPATDDTAWLSTFRLQTTLPYGLMDEFPGGLPLAIENERILGAVTEQLPLGFLPAHLRLQTDSGAPDPRPTPNITMKSEIASFPPDILATLRFQRGAKRFESPWIVLLADPRASIRWTPAIPNKAAVGCVPCERPPHVVGQTEANGVYEVWAHGHLLAARPGGSITGNYAYLGEQGRMASRVNAIVADTVRVADQGLASKTPPMFGALRVQGVLVHSGELVREAVDLAVKGRGLDFVLQRHYSSAVYSFGSLGRNFDSPLFARIRWLPDGSFDFFDGTGRVDHFTRKANQFVPPLGVFLHANGSGDGGVILRYLDNTALFFDGYGRLVRITDRNVTTIDASDGNVVHLTYNAQGRLASVVDPTARSIKFAYYGPAAPATNGVFPGLLASVTDFDGRTVRYEYDTYGRLTKVVGPDPQSPGSAQQVTTYTWGPPPTSGNFRLDVLRSGQILSERDALGRTIYSATFHSDLAWRVETVATGGGMWTYGYAAAATTVTDPNLHARKYSFDAAGRITTVAEPGDAITTFAFDEAGRLASVTRPLGDQTIFGYSSAAPNGDRRPMANVQSIIEVPRAGSPERAANITRTIAIEYGPANLPVKITSPRGVTTIHRDARGNPTSVTDPSNVASTFIFDPHGQLLSLADPRAGTNTFAYHEGTTLKSGYLKSVTTAAGIATYEVDNRGNLVKVTQPGGSAATYTVNDLDQVERENAGVALREQTFDAAGNLAAWPQPSREQVGRDWFHGTRGFTTETQRTQRGCGESNSVVLIICFSPLPLCVLCASVVNTRAITHAGVVAYAEPGGMAATKS